MRRSPALVAILLLTALSAPCPVRAAPVAEGVEIPPPPAGFTIDGEPGRGREIFLKRCATCHGEHGDGKGRIRVKPPPRNFRDTAYMKTRSDWQLYLIIREGGPAVGMARTMLPWRSLSEQELYDLVAYIRRLGQEAEGAGKGPQNESPRPRELTSPSLTSPSLIVPSGSPATP